MPPQYTVSLSLRSHHDGHIKRILQQIDNRVKYTQQQRQRPYLNRRRPHPHPHAHSNSPHITIRRTHPRAASDPNSMSRPNGRNRRRSSKSRRTPQRQHNHLTRHTHHAPNIQILEYQHNNKQKQQQQLQLILKSGQAGRHKPPNVTILQKQLRQRPTRTHRPDLNPSTRIKYRSQSNNNILNINGAQKRRTSSRPHQSTPKTHSRHPSNYMLLLRSSPLHRRNQRTHV